MAGGPFAGKPAPTFDLCRTQSLRTTSIQCGSGLAREGNLPANTILATRPLNTYRSSNL